jgi:diguanylate cyclase (GGDEF)-like protein
MSSSEMRSTENDEAETEGADAARDEAGVVHTEIAFGISEKVANPRIRELYEDWVRAARALNDPALNDPALNEPVSDETGSGLPESGEFGETLPLLKDFAPDARPLISGNLMVLRSKGSGFIYEHYGKEIAAVSGFDMTGRSTDEFHSALGRFFTKTYARVLRSSRPLYTVHQAGHANAVISWERLILPCADPDTPSGTDPDTPSGGGRILVVYNAPLDKKDVLFDGLMRASPDPILIFRPVFGNIAPDRIGEEPEVVDFSIVIGNRRAHEAANVPDGALVGGSLLAKGLDTVDKAFEIYRRVWKTNVSEEFEREVTLPTGTYMFRISVTRADDKIVAVYSDITELKATERKLEAQRVDLMYSNDILEKQAENLVDLAEDREAAMRTARDAERFVEDLIEAVPVPLFYRDKATGLFERVNQHYADLFTGDKGDLIGKPLDLVLGDDWSATVLKADAALYESMSGIQVFERDLTFPSLGIRRTVVHKAVMLDSAGVARGVAGVMMDVTEAHDLQEELKRLATTDPLTGLANRRMFLDSAHAEVERTGRDHQALWVMTLDIDHFKRVNDTFGHDIGDRVLIEVGRVIQAAARPGIDVAARFGGEEFVVLMPGTTSDEAVGLAERMRLDLAGTAVAFDGFDEPSVRFTSSFGVANLAEGESIEDVLKRADEALYLAKTGGRNKVVSAEVPVQQTA